MKTNVQVKDEPVEYQVNKLLRLYGYNLTNQSSRNQDLEPSTCAWCQKLGVRSFTLRTDNGDSKTLCSEVCFNQYRRASFKKNKGSESDNDHNTISTTTIKTKSSEKKSSRDQQSTESHRRKILLPNRRTTPTTISKIKPSHEPSPRKSSPSPSSKRPRSPSNDKILPVNLTWQPSLLIPPTIPYSYPFLPPVPPPPPPPLPAPVPIQSTNSFTTCILPSFIPLPIPIPIPLCIPIKSSCKKCAIEVNDQQCQTIIDSQEKRTRRISI